MAKRAFFYRIHAKYKSGCEVCDIITTATRIKEAEEYAKSHLAGSGYDDGSLPAFVRAERIGLSAAKKMYEGNPIDWINHDAMRRYLED